MAFCRFEDLKEIIDDLGPCLNGYLKSIGVIKHQTPNTPYVQNQNPSRSPFQQNRRR
jgi:hypothetical protein